MKTKNLNPNLAKLSTDFLYHLGLDTSMDLKKIFSDVRFICMGGSADRALAFAQKVDQELGTGIGSKNIKPLGKTERFSLYKIGPVISVSHGMGMPSVSILMHEITKLVYYAGCKDPIFMRIGTSGGIGLEPGTLVVTEEALSAGLEPFYELYILGQLKKFPAKYDQQLNQKIITANKDKKIVLGKTVAANCFYEEQTRLDGALDPGYSERDKMAFLQKAYDLGVRNFEMESLQFSAFCHRAGIRGAVICVTLVNRLLGDQITSTHDELAEFSERSQMAAISFIKSEMG